MQAIQQVMYRTESELKSNSHKQQETYTKAESSTDSTVNSNARAAAAVVVIWARLAARYKSVFLSGHPSDPNSDSYKFLMKEWCEAITGATSQDIGRAFEDMKADSRFKTYPPTSMEFKSLCSNDEDEKEVLFQQITQWKQLEQSQKSRKGLWLIQNMENWHYFKDFANEIKARKMFDTAYRNLQKFLDKGGELPEFVLEIEYEAPPPMPKEQLSSFLSDLMKTVDNPQGA